MAPSQSQIVTIAAGSALLLGVIFTFYLVRQRQKTSGKLGKRKSGKKDDKAEVSISGSVSLVQQAQGLFAREDDDRPGKPLPDHEGLTESMSWAILTNDNQNSPHLSPVNSDACINDGFVNNDESLSFVNGADDDDDDSVLFDNDTQSNTVLEQHDCDNTLLEEKPAHIGHRLSSTEHELVAMEEINIEYEELLKQHRESESQTFTSAEITEALMAAQNTSQGLTDRNAEVLSGLLTFEDIHLRHTAVQGIANLAAFTNNQNVLREKGSLPRLAKLLELQRMAMWMRHPTAASSIPTTINAITNMAINPVSNTHMTACVPTLVDISLDKETGESVCLSSLQALTNLSVSSHHHGHYTRLVQRLYEFLALPNTTLRLQALKILINLSCNADMVPHLLAAKAPEDLLVFLHATKTDDAIILRFVTLLANILHVVKDKNITASSLPSVDKAASPETMYTALLGLGNVANLKNKVFLLCKHSNEEIKNQAVRVYNHLK